MKKSGQARLLALGLRVIDGSYKSGRNRCRATPEISDRRITRSAGTPPLIHLWTACGDTSKALPTAPMPPDSRMASLTASCCIVPLSQPQVELAVNLPLVAAINRKFHAYRMSPLGKTITSRLKALGQPQSWLAEKCGVSEQAVSKWIKSGKISREKAIESAKHLEISVTQLLDPSPTPELDERWHSFPPSVKMRVLALVDELINPPAIDRHTQKPKRRA